MMIINIIAIDGVQYSIELEVSGDSNENGDEFNYVGKQEDSNGEMITIAAYRLRNHNEVKPEDVEVSKNILTTREQIAYLINNEIDKGNLEE